MKRLTIFLFTISVLHLNACNFLSKQETKTDSLRKGFIPAIKGVWVTSDYIQDIEKTKSPLKSSSKFEGIVTMIIDGKTEGDSLDIGSSLNNHEGYNFSVYFVSGQQPNNLKTNIPDYNDKTNFYELGYEIKNNDTLLFLYHYNKNNNLLNKKQFNKIHNSQTDSDAGWGIQYIVNKKLFEGNYIITDNANSQKTKVELKTDGSIVGHPIFKSYYIYTDFASGPFNNIDEICFNILPNEQKCYAYKIQGNTISLYETSEDKGNGTLKEGKLKYILIRQ